MKVYKLTIANLYTFFKWQKGYFLSITCETTN